MEQSQAVCMELCEITRTLLVMPASSGGIERDFLNFALVQTKLHNRLGVEKATKLVFCFRMLRAKEKLDR